MKNHNHFKFLSK